VFKLRPDPTNQVTWENRDRIEVRDLDGLCAPWAPHTEVENPLAFQTRVSINHHRRRWFSQAQLLLVN
jgi:hypothetical protein